MLVNLGSKQPVDVLDPLSLPEAVVQFGEDVVEDEDDSLNTVPLTHRDIVNPLLEDRLTYAQSQPVSHQTVQNSVCGHGIGGSTLQEGRDVIHLDLLSTM